MTKEINEKSGSVISYRPPAAFLEKIKEECDIEGHKSFAGFIHQIVVKHFRMKKQAEMLIGKKD